jgi:hypothetical protein
MATIERQINRAYQTIARTIFNLSLATHKVEISQEARQHLKETVVLIGQNSRLTHINGEHPFTYLDTALEKLEHALALIPEGHISIDGCRANVSLYAKIYKERPEHKPVKKELVDDSALVTITCRYYGYLEPKTM